MTVYSAKCAAHSNDRRQRLPQIDFPSSTSMVMLGPAVQGIEGVRFKRVIMDEGATDRSFNPPKEESFKRLIFCSGKVILACWTLLV